MNKQDLITNLILVDLHQDKTSKEDIQYMAYELATILMEKK